MPKDFYVKDIEGKEEITAGVGLQKELSIVLLQIENLLFMKIIN